MIILSELQLEVKTTSLTFFCVIEISFFHENNQGTLNGILNSPKFIL